MKKALVVICLSSLLAACEVIMVLAQPRAVKVQPISGKIGVKLDGKKVVTIDLPVGQWETRQNAPFDFSSPNFPEVRQAVGLLGQREAKSVLSRGLTISANLYHSDERKDQRNREIITLDKPFEGDAKALNTKFFAQGAPNLVAYYDGYNILAFQRFSVSAFQRFSVSAFQRFSVSGFRCVKILTTTGNSSLSYESKIGCPGRWQGQDVFIWFEFWTASEENLGTGVDASKQRFDEYLPEFERVVSQAVFSKDFSQVAPKISQSIPK